MFSIPLVSGELLPGMPNSTVIPALWKWGDACKQAVSPGSYKAWVAWAFPRHLPPPGKG